MLGITEDVTLGEEEMEDVTEEWGEMDGSWLGVTDVAMNGDILGVIEGDSVGVSELDSEMEGVILAVGDVA